jgi:hypothetical protein
VEFQFEKPIGRHQHIQMSNKPGEIIKNPPMESQGEKYIAMVPMLNPYSGTTFDWETLTQGKSSFVTRCQPDDYLRVDFEGPRFLESISVMPPTVKNYDKNRLNKGIFQILYLGESEFTDLFVIHGCEDKKVTTFAIGLWCQSFRLLHGNDIPTSNCIGVGLLVCRTRYSKIVSLLENRRGLDTWFHFD